MGGMTVTGACLLLHAALAAAAPDPAGGRRSAAAGASATIGASSDLGGSLKPESSVALPRIIGRRRVPPEGIELASAVEFLDGTGKSLGRLTTSKRGYQHFRVIGGGRYIASFERIRERGKRWRIKYWTHRGDIAWSCDVCCGIGRPWEGNAAFSRNGQIVAVRDIGPADECDISDDDQVFAGRDCIRLRVFRIDGREVYSNALGVAARVSPSGKYVLFLVQDRWRVVEIDTKRIHELPDVGNSTPHAVDDAGGVSFYSEHVPVGFDGRKRMRYEIGKGLFDVDQQKR